MPLCLLLPKTSRYAKSFDNAKCMSVLTDHKQLFEKCYETWDKLSNPIEREFHRQLLHNKKFQKSK